MREAIEKLEKAMKTMPHIKHNTDRNDCYCLVSEALTLLRAEQPPAGELKLHPNKKGREDCEGCLYPERYCGDCINSKQPPEGDKVALDKGSLSYCKEHKIIYLRKLPCPLCLQARLDSSEASRKELAEALKTALPFVVAHDITNKVISGTALEIQAAIEKQS
jgi:hypothetical protein